MEMHTSQLQRVQEADIRPLGRYASSLLKIGSIAALVLDIVPRAEE